MKVKRTEQIWVRPNKTLSKLCHLSKNLYNEANYLIRQEFSSNGSFINYGPLDQLLNRGQSENYRKLPSETAQGILRLLDSSWKAFFKAVKDWKKNPDNYPWKPKPPKYKRRNGEHLLVFYTCEIKNGYLYFLKKSSISPVKTRLNDDTDLREVRIVPKGVGYVIEIIYNKEVNPEKLNKDRIAGIDLGVRNIVTIANNIGEQPIVVKDGGTGIKSIQQYFNKVKAEIQSIYDKQGVKSGKRLRKLKSKRVNKAKDYVHKLSKFIVDWCENNNLGTLVIGYNPEWKQECNMGKQNNQNFVMVPYMDIINKIQYKAEEKGIDVILQEESHTSKCSFFDNELIEHHNEYIGKRKGGLFKTATGGIVNADVNGALNIIRKAIPNAFSKELGGRIGGCGHHPFKHDLIKS